MTDGFGSIFEVQPEALELARARFLAKSAAVSDQLGRLWADINLPDSAFGNLPQLKQCAVEWNSFHQHVGSDMKTIAQFLTEYGNLLGETAAAVANIDMAHALGVSQTANEQR